jgi:hypothetical protein
MNALNLLRIVAIIRQVATLDYPNIELITWEVKLVFAAYKIKFMNMPILTNPNTTAAFREKKSKSQQLLLYLQISFERTVLSWRLDRNEFCKATVIDRYIVMQLSAVTSHDTLSTPFHRDSPISQVTGDRSLG